MRPTAPHTQPCTRARTFHPRGKNCRPHMDALAQVRTSHPRGCTCWALYLPTMSKYLQESTHLSSTHGRTHWALYCITCTRARTSKSRGSTCWAPCISLFRITCTRARTYHPRGSTFWAPHLPTTSKYLQESTHLSPMWKHLSCTSFGLSCTQGCVVREFESSNFMKFGIVRTKIGVTYKCLKEVDELLTNSKRTKQPCLYIHAPLIHMEVLAGYFIVQLAVRPFGAALRRLGGDELAQLGQLALAPLEDRADARHEAQL